ncbi:LysR family transcriptional regulator [Georgenia halophila]|uniref:LysR family transcriptional regulator n=1 Tax=Georgenia halophila TaxID=620889 RepID=A0ABP8L651_9MICO
MELSWCRSFIAVLELGGFSAAASALHRSQSRISAHVADLERHLGETLLNRDVHPPTLTAAGEAFLPHARGMTDEWTAAVAAVEARRGDISGTVAIGSVPSVSSQILAPLLTELSRRHPRVSFEVHEGPNSWLDEALTHRTVEVALRPLIQVRPRPVFEHQVLLDDPFVVVLPADHDLARQESVDLEQLAGHAILTTGEAGLDARVGGEFRQVLERVGIDRDHSMAVTQPTTVSSFVEVGLGLGLIGALPARMLHHPAVVHRPLNHPGASRQIAAHWARTRSLSPAGTAFLRELVRFTRSEFGVEYPGPGMALLNETADGAGA